jgi:hypothetical protein
MVFSYYDIDYQAFSFTSTLSHTSYPTLATTPIYTPHGATHL